MKWIYKSGYLLQWISAIGTLVAVFSTIYFYVFDYGAPVGFRLVLHNPQHILRIVSQNGNIYEEGLGEKWSRRKDYWTHPTTDTREKLKVAFSATTIKKQYLTGEDPYLIAPDGYSLDIYYTK